MDYSVLKSGTDIRGVASDIFNNKVNLTDEAVKDITKAFVVWYVNKFSKSYNEMVMAVGHDSRITGPEISQKVVEALSESGVKVIDCGLSSTPAMFMTTVDLKTDAAIEITASHHPADRNGLKFFLPTGGLNASDISEIIELANSREEVISSSKGEIEPINYMEQYAARLRKMICDAVGKTEAEKPLKEYKIVVDAGNGVGGFYAKEVLEKLGADIKGSRFLEPDGMFPNHIPNPENETAMESICEAVVSSNADLGLIFDTDVDRAGCVGPDGREINRNRLIALASYIATNGRKNAIVVTDSVTSDGLKKFIEEDLGCVHYRYRRGYKNGTACQERNIFGNLHTSSHVGHGRRKSL
jgi:phosphomannomutase